MSGGRRAVALCKKCGGLGDVVIWESVNTQLNPKVKEKLMQGNLFRYICPKCGSVHRIDYGMLFHQMEDRRMLFLAKDAKEVEERIQSIGWLEKANAAGTADDYLYRVVRSDEHLREKIYIFDQGLDDRVIEVMKVFIISSLEPASDKLLIDKMYLNVTDGAPKDFSIQMKYGRKRTVAFSQEMYDSVKKEFFMEDDGKHEYIVNHVWALEKTRSIG